MLKLNTFPIRCYAPHNDQIIFTFLTQNDFQLASVKIVFILTIHKNNHSRQTKNIVNNFIFKFDGLLKPN